LAPQPYSDRVRGSFWVPRKIGEEVFLVDIDAAKPVSERQIFHAFNLADFFLVGQGRGKIREMELRVMSRVAEEASTPAYHALMTVLRRQKPGWRWSCPGSSSRCGACCERRSKKNLRKSIGSKHPFPNAGEPLPLGCARVMGHHDNGLLQLPLRRSIMSRTSSAETRSRSPWFIRHKNRGVGDDGPGNSHPLLLAS